MKFLLIIFCLFRIPTNTIPAHNDCKVSLSTHSLNSGCPAFNSETFKIKSDCELNYSKTMVFNRWGKAVFQEFNTNLGFNGTYKNANLPDGTYFYLVSYQIKNEPDTVKLQGYLQIYE